MVEAGQMLPGRTTSAPADRSARRMYMVRARRLGVKSVLF